MYKLKTIKINNIDTTKIEENQIRLFWFSIFLPTIGKKNIVIYILYTIS